MSIADKITSITNHLTSDYEGIENLGVDLTNIDKNIENIRTCLDTIYSNLPKVTGTDGTEVTLSPTLKGKLGIVEKGNSTQEPLNNLFNISDGLGLNNATLLDNDYIKIGYDNTSGSSVVYCSAYTNNLNIQTSTKYLIIGEVLEVSGQGTLYLTQRNKPNNRGQFPASPYSIQNLSAGDIIISEITSISDFTGTTRGLATSVQVISGESAFVTLRISVLADTSITASTFYYCPYGATGPTPSFPEPIKSVTGNNNVVVKGKNEFNKNTVTSGALMSDGTINSDSGYFTSDFIEISDELISSWANRITDDYVRIGWYDSTKTFISRTLQSIVSTARSYQITNSNNASYIRISIAVNNLDSLQVENGDTATTYMPYVTPQTLPLNLGSIELNGIGTYRDLIFQNVPSSPYYDNTLIEGAWYVKNGYYHYSGKLSYGSSPFNTTYNRINAFLPLTYSAKGSVTQSLCNKLKAKPNGSVNASQPNATYIVRPDTASRQACWVWLDDITTQAQAETFLDNTDFELIYELATPIDTQITDTTLISQLEAIDKAQSYNGTTIITSTYDSANAQMILSASALKGE